MPTMKDLVAKHTELGQADLEWLQLLTGDWQLLSDLSFADLVLWVPRKATAAGSRWPTAVPAPVSPSTTTTSSAW